MSTNIPYGGIDPENPPERVEKANPHDYPRAVAIDLFGADAVYAAEAAYGPIKD